MSGRPPRYAIPLLVGLGLLFRMPALSTLASPLRGDPLEYESLAWKLASGQGYTSSTDLPEIFAPPGEPTAVRTPGLPLFAAVPYRLFGRRPEVVRFLLVVLNAASVGLLFSLAWRRYAPAVALVSATAWACWPTTRFTYFASHSFEPESLAVPLLIFAVWVFDRTETVLSSIVAGLALGFVFLSRGQLIAIVPPAIALFCLLSRARLRRLLVVMAISALPGAAWTVRNLVTMHAAVQSTQLGCALWFGNNAGARGSWDGNWRNSPQMAKLLAAHPELPRVPEPVKSRIFTAAAWRDVREGGWSRLAWLESRKLLLFLWPREATYGTLWWLIPVLLALPLGIVVVIARQRDPVSLLLLAAVMGSVLVTLVFYHDSRYRFTVEPAMILLATMGAHALVVETRRRRAPRS